MRGDDRQAYDRGTSLFSPDGRIYQVEYAREAVKRGAPAVGIRTADGVVLAALTRTGSSLQESESVEKLHKLDDHVGAVTAGHAADARTLVDFARRIAQQDRYRYGEAVSVDTLTTAIADRVQESTQAGGTRPFGAALLVGGVTDDEPALTSIGPEGAPETWRATVIGRERERLQSFLEEEYDEDMSTEDGISLALRTLAEVDEEVDPGDVTAGVVTAEGFRKLSPSEIESRFGAE